MTPSKEKKALPSTSSNTTVVPDRPTTYPQWQTALQQVKVLYLKRQYKQCTLRCTELLTGSNEKIHPLHATFLYFYTALSHESLARSTHNLSAAKLTTLHLARDSYEAAAASLPRPAHLPTTSCSDDDEEEEEHDSSTPPFSDTASSTSSYSDTTSDPPHNNNDNDRPSSPHTIRSRSRSPSSSSPSSLRTDNLKPSPLRIRKKPLHFPPTPTPTSRPQLTLFSPQPRTHTSYNYNYNYNTHLISFGTMLHSHVDAVDRLLRETRAAQVSGGRGGAYVAGDGESGWGKGNRDGEDEGRRARVQRLRGMGWRRGRFGAERYEGLCARALAEL